MTQNNSKSRDAKAKRRKPEKLEFVQPFLPVKDIQNGIVETTDGRYVKILEIEPIGASSNKMAAEFCLEIFKVIRGYGGAAIAATQDLSDFFGLDDGKYGRAIINNSKNKIILNLEQDEAQYVKDVLKLTRTEVRSITQFERGEALIHSNNNKVPD